ncbi:MAG TPA: toxin-antitoxin system HicB family antitoxin [Pirellulales bacterium]
MVTKEQQVFQVASELYRQKPDWLTFFREVMGMTGIVRQTYTDPEAFSAFERTEEYRKIQDMLAALRKGAGAQAEEEEPMTVITVRLPKSLHAALKAEAHDSNTSMNKLCISKLLRSMEEGEAGAEGDSGSEPGVDLRRDDPSSL